ncbi:RICIN domain-containing protein [Paenibacillus sp. P26]|nr:RICIN domain-containing protein [Paenibacillus sp. P26]
MKWVPAGGPNGMVIVASKWALDSDGQISGGQNFYVNYNLGQGPWERLPFAVTYDANDSQGGYFSGFAQAFDTSVDGQTLFQATNVENKTTTYNDIRVGSIPLNQVQYEAEKAATNHIQLVSHVDAEGGSKVGYINYSDSYVQFTVRVPSSGTYTVNVRYDNGGGANSSHLVSVNGGSAFTLNYPATVDWGRYQWVQFTANLNAGANTIKFAYNGTYAELDAIAVYQTGTAANGPFKVVNRNSGKSLEVSGNSGANLANIGQWGDTGCACQLWTFNPAGGGFYKVVNWSSGKLMQTDGGERRTVPT